MKQKLWVLCALLLFGTALAQEPPVATPPSTRKEASVTPLIAKRYLPLGDGAQIKDTKTGLIWQRCAVEMNWNGQTCTGAHNIFQFDAAQTLTGNGWRVPDKDELASIVDETVAAPTINRKAFPGTPSVAFWSSSVREGNSRYAWLVIFYDGLVVPDHRMGFGAVRLVRSGQ